MTPAEMLSKLKTLLDIQDTNQDTLLSIMLDDSGEEILNRLYPYRIDGTTYSVPERYQNKQVKLAQWAYLKTGAEGQIEQYENGVKRVWGKANIPDDIIGDITPYVGVPTSTNSG